MMTSQRKNLAKQTASGEGMESQQSLPPKNGIRLLRILIRRLESLSI